MRSESSLFTYDVGSTATGSLAIQRRVDEIAAETFERAEKRRAAIAELKSGFYSASERISAWEKLHGLRLPLDAMHPVLTFISQSTGLTLAEVHEEQGQRRERARARVPAV